MLAERKVKIVATIGPATNTIDKLRKAIEAGMNVARLNFSHGDHALHKSVIEAIRSLSVEMQTPVAILQDLQGPKIRVYGLPDEGRHLQRGEMIQLASVGAAPKSDELIEVDIKELEKYTNPGQKVLFDDGLIEARVIQLKGSVVECEVIYGGHLKNRKGVNIPGANLPIDGLTDKDIKDLHFGLEQNVDYVALSFVRRAEDMRRLKEIINAHRPMTRVVAKIEMFEALENLEDIIAESDGVMVARGDLAIEVGQTQLPLLQKRIIQLANQLSKPVITATQMLDSMVENPRPTRAEITDVANAVLDGTDALMLSAESASGQYPFDCIRTMHEISLEVERHADFYYDISIRDEEYSVPEALAASACLTALKVDAKAIVCLSTTGKTATYISSFRPRAPIIAVTTQMETLQRLELAWGIQSFVIRPYRSIEEAIEQIEPILMQVGLLKKGDRIVVSFGAPLSEKSKTNALRVYEIRGDGHLKNKLPSIPIRFLNK